MITLIVAIITIIFILAVNNYYSNEYFIGSQFNIINGYFPQAVVTNQVNTAKDLTTCINECDKDSVCTGFIMSGENCWKLKANSFPAFIKTNDPIHFNPITGIKQTTSCDPVQQIFGGKCSSNDFPGNDLLPTPFFTITNNLSNCVETCIDNDKCMGISYDTKKNKCFLKTKIKGNGNPTKDRVSWISPRNI
jgi:hypothetical protein